MLPVFGFPILLGAVFYFFITKNLIDSGLMALLGGVLLLLWAIAKRFLQKKAAHIERLKQTGKRVEARFEKLEENTTSRARGSITYYTIVCQWDDGKNKHTFESDDSFLEADPDTFKPTEKIPVYINPEDPEDYYVDTSELEKLNNETA